MAKTKYIYQVSIDGMACGHCEAHVNNLFYKHLNVRKVKSSHRKNRSIIVSNEPLNEEMIRKALDDSGYKILKIEQQ